MRWLVAAIPNQAARPGPFGFSEAVPVSLNVGTENNLRLPGKLTCPAMASERRRKAPAGIGVSDWLALLRGLMKADQQISINEKPFKFRPHVMKKILPGVTGARPASVHQKVPSGNNPPKLTLRFGWFVYQKPGLSFSNFSLESGCFRGRQQSPSITFCRMKAPAANWPRGGSGSREWRVRWRAGSDADAG